MLRGLSVPFRFAAVLFRFRCFAAAALTPTGLRSNEFGDHDGERDDDDDDIDGDGDVII